MVLPVNCTAKPRDERRSRGELQPHLICRSVAQETRFHRSVSIFRRGSRNCIQLGETAMMPAGPEGPAYSGPQPEVESTDFISELLESTVNDKITWSELEKEILALYDQLEDVALEASLEGSQKSSM